MDQEATRFDGVRGAKIAAVRRALGMSRQELAWVTGLGNHTVARAEAGEFVGHIPLRSIASVLDVDVALNAPDRCDRVT